jgi:streptogramin lyase
MPAWTPSDTPVRPTSTSTPAPTLSPTPDKFAGWTRFVAESDYRDLPGMHIEPMPVSMPNFFGIGISPDGSVWANSYQESMLRFDGSKWESFLPTPEPPMFWNMDFDFAADGSLWCVGAEDIVLQFDGGIWQTHSFQQTGYKGHIQHIKTAPDGTIWFTAGDRGLLTLKGTTWKRISLESAAPYNEDINAVNAIAAAPDGTMWFGTDAGVVKYLVTRQGEVWFSVLDAYYGPPGGREEFYYIARFSEETESHIDYKDLIGIQTWSIAEAPDDALWFATNNGLYRYDGTGWKHWGEDFGIYSVEDVAIADDGTVWMVHGDQILRYQPTE